MSDQEEPTSTPAENPLGPPIENPQAAPTPWGITEVFIGIFFSLVLGLGSVLLFQAIASDPHRVTLPYVFSALVGGWIAYGGMAYLVTRNLPGGMGEQLGFRFKYEDDLWKGVLFGTVGQLLVALVYLPLHWLAPDLVKNLDDPAKNLTEGLSSWRWVVFAVMTGLVSPICEELFFRGVTLRAFARRWGNGAGILCSGIIFGIIHFEALQTFALIVFGILLAWRATRTGRIGETIVAHATFNLISVIALFYGVN
jgi:membrane protease YdiL (CAAX protease family)